MLGPGDASRADLPPQYNKDAYLRQQLLLSGFCVVHVLMRLLAHSDASKRQQHSTDVVTQMRLRGAERVLVLRCGKGQWVNAIARALDRGGKVTGVDDWLSKECPFDEVTYPFGH